MWAFRVLAILLVFTGCGSQHFVEDTTAAQELAVLGTDAMLLAEKNTPSLYFGDGRTATLMWDMSGPETIPTSARFPGLFLLDVKVLFETVGGVNQAVGYTFTNPRLQMSTGEKEAFIQGVVVRVNGNDAPNAQNFLSAEKIAKGIDSVNIYAGSVNSKLTEVSSSDTISVAFTNIVLRDRTDNPPVPPQPTLSANNPYTRQTQVPITVGNDSTARRWCLTASPVKPASTSDPCPGYVWLATRPANFDLITAGRLVGSGESVQFYLWVANSDLKISNTPATASVIFDSTVPAAPALASVTVSDSQMASLDGLTDSNETVNWCVKEASTQNGVQDDQGCSYVSAKPNYVGIKGGGLRYVRIFVRDRAGNAASSPVRTTNNPFGQITYTQLVDGALGARGALANSCASCHGAGSPQQGVLDTSSYAGLVAKKSQILNRIENSGSPMPPTGLLSEKQRGLIRLWLTQTGTPVQ